MSLLSRGDVVTTQSGSHSRTITGYLAHLLEHPRWLMECDIDFTQCPYQGRYEDFVAECETCIYGEECKWLSSYTISAIKEAPLTDLVDTLENAVDYVAGRQAQGSFFCRCSKIVLRNHQRGIRRVSVNTLGQLPVWVGPL